MGRRAGVQGVVKLSALSFGHGAADPITIWHRAGEQVAHTDSSNSALARAGKGFP